jgi:proline iminopeptidase
MQRASHSFHYRLIFASLAAAFVTGQTESRVPIGKASLYCREIGRGQPVIVLHGGPDFDSAYLLPELDRLADGFRLIYYDQRGRASRPRAYSRTT